MNSEQFIKFRQMIESEFSKACIKHPKFCDKMTTYTLAGSRSAESMFKHYNSSAPYYADELLKEELFEALTAYKEGDKAHCIQELAQCGAVILRMMDFVQNEIDNKEA